VSSEPDAGHREEIANRYSYYYARLENGTIAPLLGFILSALVLRVFWHTEYVLAQPSFSPFWIVAPAIVVAIAVLWRIPQLFRELDDLEVALVRLQRDSWPLITRIDL
jgi:MFS family permease